MFTIIELRDDILLVEILKHTKLSWKFWKYFERSTRLDQVKNEIKLLESKIIESCQDAHESSVELSEPTESFHYTYEYEIIESKEAEYSTDEFQPFKIVMS